LTEGVETQATGTRGPAPDVFISYASHDAPVAQRVCAMLESRAIRCWIAPRDVVPGTLYADAIVRAINESKLLVLVLSGAAVASLHVGKELERATSKRHPIIALKIDAAPLTPSFEYFLSESQWIETTLGLDPAAAQLADAVQRHLSPQSAAAAATAAPASARAHDAMPAAPALPAKRRRSWLIAAAAAAALAAAGTAAFKLWPTGHVAAADRSIAVLPFSDISEKHDQQYFAEGIAEEVLDRLAKVPGLRVVGHVSSFKFKTAETESAKIGTSLGVTYLLEGSVRREAARVRVTAQLLDARSGSQRWSDSFDSDEADVLHVQDIIAAAIARALQIAVEVEAGSRSAVKSPQVLDAYLRGLHARDHLNQEGCETAVADFQQALNLDPGFAPAAIALARTYAFIGEEGWSPPKVAFERARETALLAERLDPKNPSPHITLAEVHTHFDWDWSAAEHELQQGFSLGPRETYGVATAASLAAARGNWDLARALAIESIELDPLDAAAQGTRGLRIYMRTGRFAEAEQSLRRALQIAPHWGAGQYYLGESLLLQGRYDEALREFLKENLDDGQLEGSAMVYFATGRKAESDADLAASVRRNGSSWPSEIARVYGFRGEDDQAIEWLNRAYEYHDEDLYSILDDPLMQKIAEDPRFKDLLRKMHLSP
jgi:TolB-like protein